MRGYKIELRASGSVKERETELKAARNVQGERIKRKGMRKEVERKGMK